MIVLKTYFGMQPGQTLGGFQIECRALETSCGSREAYLDFCEEVAKAAGVTLERM